MIKRVISLLLCVLMLVPVVAGCAKKDKAEGDNGAYINMYLTDQIYDLDPAKAYNNESALRLVSLVFDNLFVLDKKGKVKKSLVEEYKIREDESRDEYEMIITLKDTCWSDGTAVTSNDVYYAWTRILQSDNNFDAAALLFDIKNARAAKEGDVSIDDVAISAINEKQVQIFFEEKIDYDQFILNLTSYSLVPLREDIANKTVDWAKKPSLMVSSGPFKCRELSYSEGDERVVLERNAYYFRDAEEDAIDESVTPYRIIIDYTMSDEEIMAAYEAGELFFVGDIPLSVRGNYKDTAEIKDALSTHTYFLNEDAVVRYYSESGFATLANSNDLQNWKNGKPSTPLVEGTHGEKIFANEKIREALSLAIDREKIAEAVVFAKAATGLVPYGVYDSNSRKDLFREVGGDILSTSADVAAAKALIAETDIDPNKFMFAISVSAYDDVHMAIAEMVQQAWNELGFHVQIKAIDTIVNVDNIKFLGTKPEDVPKDFKDDLFTEAFYAGKFEVAAIDYTALSPDAFSVLAPFAKCFTGRAASTVDSAEFMIPSHITGYNSEEYNELIESAYAEKDIKDRAQILHEAEELILDEMAVIPIIFNQTATLTHDSLSKVKFTYYGTAIFTKAKLKDYELYVPSDEE